MSRSSAELRDRWTRRLLAVALLVTGSAAPLGCGMKVATHSMPLAVAAYPQPEQQMLAALTMEILRDQGYEVTDYTSLQSEWHVRQAMETGRVQVAWQNLGTVWFTYLGHDQPVTTEASLFRQVKAEDYSHGVVWLNPLSWSYRQSVIMKSQQAADLGLSTISGLATYVSSINPDVSICLSEDQLSDLRGLTGLQRVYGFRFATANVHQMNDEQALAGVLDGTCDCAIGTVKDLALHQNDLVLLRDDATFFSASGMAPTLHVTAMNQYPELERILGELSDALDEATLSAMERQAVSGRQSYRRVAEDFLRKAGLVD